MKQKMFREMVSIAGKSGSSRATSADLNLNQSGPFQVPENPRYLLARDSQLFGQGALCRVAAERPVEVPKQAE